MPEAYQFDDNIACIDRPLPTKANKTRFEAATGAFQADLDLTATKLALDRGCRPFYFLFMMPATTPVTTPTPMPTRRTTSTPIQTSTTPALALLDRGASGGRRSWTVMGLFSVSEKWWWAVEVCSSTAKRADDA